MSELTIQESPHNEGGTRAEKVAIRIHGSDADVTLVYLPGVHGDWTLVGGFRRALQGRVRFVEVTYPRTLTWSLEDYGRGIEAALSGCGIRQAWLLGESFGSQVVWNIVKRGVFLIDGVILAGGFARHPAPWMAGVARVLIGRVSLRLLRALLFSYSTLARWRFRHSPETLANFQEIVGRRTELDCQAAKHRLHLVAGSDPRAIVQESRLPIYGLAGLFDPVVPWYWARSWLTQHCIGFREYRVIWRADHNVLGTAPKAAAAQVLRWMSQATGTSKPS